MRYAVKKSLSRQKRHLTAGGIIPADGVFWPAWPENVRRLSVKGYAVLESQYGEESIASDSCGRNAYAGRTCDMETDKRRAGKPA